MKSGLKDNVCYRTSEDVMSEKDSLSRDHQLKLEAYRSLQQENSSEARDTMTLDVIFVAGSTAWFFKSPGPLTTVPPWFLSLSYAFLAGLWFLLALRTHLRIRRRVKLMLSIERCVGFCAYRAMESYTKQKRFLLLKYPYYRGLVLGVILLVIVYDALKC